MQLRNLGRSGLRVSAVGLGCNNFGGRIDTAASRRVIERALDLGVTLLDTADTYGKPYGNTSGSERALGEILGARRKDVVLATKFGNTLDDAGVMRGAARRYVMSACEASLARLRTDWIDLYQVHFPDPLTPIEETLRALDDLVRQGKVRYIGCSNFAAWQVVEAQWTARHHNLNGFVSCQDEYSLLVRRIEKEGLPVMRSYGLGLLPYYPLASGLLTGKYMRGAPLPAGARLTDSQRLSDRYMTAANWQRVERLTAFAQARGHTLLELALSWLAAQPLVASVISGATSPEQIEMNVRAAGWSLGADDLAEIDRLCEVEG